VLTGLKQGDEIVTGTYRILRTLKSGSLIKRDTAPMGPPKDGSSTT
jgi:HlyD family secretion protein